MSFVNTDERLLRHLQNKHCAHSTTLSMDKVGSEPPRAIVKAGRQSPCCTHAASSRVILDVGGHSYKSTQQTLNSVKGSRFSQLLCTAVQYRDGRKLYIERNGEVFPYILDYLRACRLQQANFKLPPRESCQAVLAEADFYKLPGLVQQLQMAMSGNSSLTQYQRHAEQRQRSLDIQTPIRFATVHAAVSGHKPQLGQAQLQQLSQQVNQQVSMYTNRGFDIKDVSSGMTHATGSKREDFVLHVTILLSARLPAMHDTAKLNSMLSCGASSSQQDLSRTDSSTSTATSIAFVQSESSFSSSDLHISDTVSALRRRLHSSIAPAVATATSQPNTPDLSPQQTRLLPTPRLIASPGLTDNHSSSTSTSSSLPVVTGSQAPVTPAVGLSSHLPGKFAVDLSTAADIGSAASGSIPAQWPSPHEHQLHEAVSDASDTGRYGSPVIPVIPPAAVSTDALLSGSSESDVLDDLQSDIQTAPAAANFVTNDVYQHLSAQSLATADATGTDDVSMHHWQANSIFDSQASLWDTLVDGTAVRAPTEQHDPVLESRQSLTDLPEVRSDCGTQQCEGVSGTNHVEHGSSCSMHDEDQHQRQVFSDLFDTQLSQFLTTQEEALSVSAELQASAALDAASVHSQATELSSTPFVEFTTTPGLTSSATINTTWVEDASMPNGGYCHSQAGSTASSKATAAATSTAAADAPTKASHVGSVATKHEPEPHDGDVSKGEPVTTAVSTAQLEIMGWDMFADTLGNFRLLSASGSDAESATNLLPEPAELSPLTPEAGLHEPRMTQHRVSDDSPFLGAGHSPASPEICRSQDLAHFDFPEVGGQMIQQGFCAVEYMDSSPVSPLEWEYRAMMLDDHFLSERYPGMLSDADECDAHGVGCLGDSRSCAVRFEQCMSCYPCATCACCPSAALRPGRHHKKSVFRRLWATIRAKGSACVHPSFSHERYS